MEVAERADAAGAGRVEGVEVAGGMKRRDCGLLWLVGLILAVW